MFFVSTTLLKDAKPRPSSGNGWPISTKLSMCHRCLKYYNVYINHDPVMTLIYISARSSSVPHPGATYMYITIIFLNIFFPETARPIKAKFYMKHL